MVLEQEIASIIKFLLASTGRPSPYYYKVPQSFAVPAAFFPQAEIETGGETLITYNMDYTLYVKFFARTTEDAYRLGLMAVTAIRGKRNLIPLIEEDGEDIPGKGIRVNDPDLKMLDDGAAQVKVSWRSRRPYDDEVPMKMVTYDLNSVTKTVDAAMEAELERYITEPKGGSL